MTDFTTIDERWSLWTPSEAERAHFCATRETVQWLCCQRDGETDPKIANAYAGLARKALGVHAEAAEPPLTQLEIDTAWSIAIDMAGDWKTREHAHEWVEAWGRKGAREMIAEWEAFAEDEE